MREVLRNMLIAVMLAASSDAMAQGAYRYRLYLADKPEDSVVQLSRRALERRERQEIALDDQDRCVSPAYLKALQNQGLVIVTQSRWMNTVVVMRPDGEEIAADTWQQFPWIDMYMRVTSTEEVEMPEKARQLDAPTPSATAEVNVQLSQIHGDEMIATTPWGKGMLVAMVDGGFTNANQIPSISQHLIGSYDPYFPEEPEHLYTIEDGHHGTHCLSIMAADGTLGLYGSAACADYYLIRTEMVPSESALEEDMWICGVEHADSIGADLVSSSLGYTTFEDQDLNHTQEELGTGQAYITQAAEVACQRGMIICNSAGNEGTNEWHSISFPADAPHLLTVGAVDSNGVIAEFSSYGFLSPYVKPDVCGLGSRTLLITPDGQLATGSGTSYSTPLICGCVATLWSAAPSLKAQQICDLVRQSASRYETPDEHGGYGLPDFAVALSRALAMVDAEQGLKELHSSPTASTVDHDLQGRKSATKGLLIRQGKVIFQR